MGTRLSYDQLAELINSHLDALVLFGRQWSCEVAADVVQEAFLRLVRSVRKGDTAENIVPWLDRVVRNELITQYHDRQFHNVL